VGIKERLKTCPQCGYEWLARTPKPPKCPRCQKTFEAEKTKEQS